MKPTALEERERIVAWLEAGPLKEEDFEQRFIAYMGNGWAIDFAQRIKSGKHWEGE